MMKVHLEWPFKMLDFSDLFGGFLQKIKDKGHRAKLTNFVKHQKYVFTQYLVITEQHNIVGKKLTTFKKLGTVITSGVHYDMNNTKSILHQASFSQYNNKV